MLIKLQFSNFYSFADETEISFELGKKPSPSAWDIEVSPDRRLNKVVAVMGANGSGKTKLIQSLAFLSWFINNSFLGSDPEDELPFNPHKLSKKSKPTWFELTFRHDDEEYLYKLELTAGVVSHESLHRKTSRLFSYVFTRDLTPKGTYLIKQKGFGFDTTKARKIRSNASMISAAHNYDIEVASNIVRYFARGTSNVSYMGRRHFNVDRVLDATEFFIHNENLQPRMESLMRDFDLGIDAVSITEAESVNEGGKKSKRHVPVTTHSIGDKKFQLPLIEESSGTQSAFSLLPHLLFVLEHRGIAIIDEIDNDLHPHMLPRILDLFMFEHTNPHHAQLIFTCHTPEILNLLSKHQVYLTEKADQKSEAWRLDEVKGLRTDDNLYAKYMAGALSAIPNL